MPIVLFLMFGELKEAGIHESVLREVKELFDKGYREVTLLGQNVDSYNWNEIPVKLLDFLNFLKKLP